MIYSLPAGFTYRSTTMEDAEAVFALITANDIALYSVADPTYTIDDLRRGWLSQDHDMTRDNWVVLAPDEEIVGYAAVRPYQHVRLFASPIVLPAYAETGIFDYLLELAEARGRQHIVFAPSEARVVITSGISSLDTRGQQHFERAGFSPVRSFLDMEITMTEPPPLPQWPDGITVRSFIPGQDAHTTFEALDEAFTDHWGHIPGDFEWWNHRLESFTDFDPTLWFLACEGDQIAAISLCELKDRGTGWVDDLAVRRPWRRKGLGMALLQHSFGEFYRRGIYTVGLGVDSQNLTGAVRLYERGGMHMVRQYISFEKELRPGKELSTQTLEE